jgi:hypothetical protein
MNHRYSIYKKEKIMNKMFAFAVLNLIATSVFAARTPVSDCRVRVNGRETGQVIRSSEFFSTVANVSQETGCSYGKIYYEAGSGRVYSYGRLVADPSTGKKYNLNNTEANRAKHSVGGRCLEVSCDEIGVIRGNEPISNEIPVGLPPVIVVSPGSNE